MREKIRKVSNYNLYMIVENSIAYIYTKLFWKRARLVRYPIRVHGKKRISYGKGFTVGNNSKIDIVCQRTDGEPCLVVGENCVFGDNLHIAANYRVVIGKNLLAASRVFITDSNHGEYSDNISVCSEPSEEPVNRKICCKETSIGDNVWLGENVSILAGASIGSGVIVASNAVVTGNIPDNCLIGGVPAKVIKIYNNEHGWSKLLELGVENGND